MRVLGLISGTSHDGVDACLVEFAQEGSRLTARVLASDSVPYPADLRARIVAALPPHPVPMSEVCELDALVGEHFTRVAAGLAAGHEVDLVCSHGQTVFHWVQDGVARGTLQLGNPAPLAETLGVPVLSDLRAADIAAGGQGAPLVCILDVLALAGRSAPAAALNLGGIANMTVVAPGREPYAYDIGPANALVDAAVERMTGGQERYDKDGGYAARGRVDDGLLATLLDEPYYAAPWPKSTGKELFHLGYLEDRLAGRALDPVDVVATATELTARVVGQELRRTGVTEVYASGGGTANPFLMQRIRAAAPEASIAHTDELGVPADTKEALAFALIGYLTAHGHPGNVPSCTGASGPRVLGRLGPPTAFGTDRRPPPESLVVTR